MTSFHFKYVSVTFSYMINEATDKKLYEPSQDITQPSTILLYLCLSRCPFIYIRCFMDSLSFIINDRDPVHPQGQIFFIFIFFRSQSELISPILDYHFNKIQYIFLNKKNDNLKFESEKGSFSEHMIFIMFFFLTKTKQKGAI